MFRKVAPLEILKSSLSTGVQAYSKLLTKFLIVGLKLTENFQEVISDGAPYQKLTNLQNAALSLARF